MLKSICSLCVWLILSAGLADAELVPIGDWPGDGTRTAIEIDDQLFRNCGRILERWDLETDPPHLLDSLILDSPPIDLLDWDGLLLVLLEDGTLKAHDLLGDWIPPVWSLQLSQCATELHRRGRWLLPIEPDMHLIDLENPLQPIVDDDPLGSNIPSLWSFGGTHACFMGDRLVGDWSLICPDWELNVGACWMDFPQEGPGDTGAWIEGDLATWAGGITDMAATPTYLAAANGRIGLFNGNTGALTDEGGEATRLAWQGSILLAAADSSVSTYEPLVGFLFEMGVLETPAGQDLRIQGATALVASPDQTSHVSLADPFELSVTDTLPAWGKHRAMAWAGDLLLVRQRALQVFHTTAEGMTRVGSLELGAGTLLAGCDQLAMAEVDGGIAILDLSNPADPYIAAIVPNVHPQRLAMLEQLGVWQEGDEIVFIDLRQPDQPQELTRLAIPNVVGLEAMEHAVAAKLYGQAGLRLIHATPEDIHVAALVEGGWRRAALMRNRLVKGSISPGHILTLQVLEVSNPDQPVVESVILEESVTNFQLFGGRDQLGVAVDRLVDWPLDPTMLLFFEISEQGGLVKSDSLELGEYQISHEVTLSRADNSAGRLAWHRPEGGVLVIQDDSVTGVPERVQPDAFSFSALPNPFNPRTILELSLAQAGPARLVVYDLLGREVAVLLEGPQVAGTQRIVFDGGNLASGLYLARLEAADATRTIKLALVR